MRKVEFLDQGLVTTRHPALLKPGELALCDNMTYVPSSSSPRRALGRTLGVNIAAFSVNGSAITRFDNGSDFLFANCNGKLWRSPAGGALSFFDVEAFTNGTDLHAVHYQDKFILMNGVNSNRLARNDGTTRSHGMQPVTGQLKATVQAGVFSTTINADYEYWVTEAAIITENGATTTLESTFTGTPARITIATFGSQAVLLTLPTPNPLNTLATKFYVYRSLPLDTEEKGFPIGQRIANIPITNISFIDGAAITTGTSNLTAGTVTATIVGGSSASFTLGGGAASPQAALVSNDGQTSIFNQTAPGGSPLSPNSGYLTLSVFGIPSTIVEPISGITLTVRIQHNNIPCRVSVYLSPDGGTTLTAVKYLNITNSEVAVTVGEAESATPWGRYWTTAELSDANFRAYIKFDSWGTPLTVTTLDQAQLTIYHNASGTTSEDIFPSITIEVGGVTSSIGSHGPPPKSRTGSVFEDCVVLNDEASPSFIRYSLAGQPEYFPSLYFIDLETESNDRVQGIESMGAFCMIGTDDHLFRLNYLPTESDASYSRGRAFDLVDARNGFVGPKAFTLFRGPEGRVVLAFASRNGIMATDGYRTWALTEDIDWGGILNEANFAKSKLVNNPERWELVLYYSSGSEIDKRLHFSYHPTHIKEGGKLKVSGPVTAVNGANTLSAVVMYNKTDGTVLEYTGYSNGDIYASGGLTNIGNTALKTREMYHDGFGHGFKLNETYFHHANTGATIAITPITHLTGGASISQTSANITAGFVGMSKLGLSVTTESIQYQLAETGGVDQHVDFIVMDIDMPHEEMAT